MSHNPLSFFQTFLFGGSVRTGVGQRVVFLSDVEVLAWSSMGAGFARSASAGPVARMAESGHCWGIVRFKLALLPEGLRRRRRFRMRLSFSWALGRALWREAGRFRSPKFRSSTFHSSTFRLPKLWIIKLSGWPLRALGLP